ncbi:MAG TPA: 2-hydroxychromene-2-carboxylate isomerase [Polyangiales bacterium]|nr:2-hydroxychromene-2-carboxylate isomerase [Polyangiales bacterium]
MSRTLEFVFDFASPNAYLARCVLPEIAERTGAELRLLPCLLGGIFKLAGNQSPIAAFAQVRGKLEYEALETQRFIAKHRLHRFHFNPHFPMNTLLIMRGLIAARRSGVADAYLEAVSAATWENGLKMDDPAVVEKVLRDAGLDSAALLAMTQDPEVKAELLSNTEAVVKRGAFGIPTFFVGDEMFFGKERLDQVEAFLSS